MRGHSYVGSESKGRPFFFLNVALLACALLFCAQAAAARQQPAAGAQPRAALTRENVLSFLRGLAPERRELAVALLAAAVRDSGVDFELTSAAEAEMLSAGAEPN